MNAFTEVVEVMRYSDGTKLGVVATTPADRELYARCVHPEFQWPEGTARAGGVFTADQLDALKITPETVIYLEF